MVYYVYGLIDPRDGKCFYIGKGKGKRAWDHVKKCRSGHIDNGAKHMRIKEILKSGMCVIVKMMKTHISESEAFELERELISKDKQELTNIMNGCRSSDEKHQAFAKDQLDFMKDEDSWIKGWHPDCIKGFNGETGARAFYRKFVAWLTPMSNGEEYKEFKYKNAHA